MATLFPIPNDFNTQRSELWLEVAMVGGEAASTLQQQQQQKELIPLLQIRQNIYIKKLRSTK